MFHIWFLLLFYINPHKTSSTKQKIKQKLRKMLDLGGTPAPTTSTSSYNPKNSNFYYYNNKKCYYFDKDNNQHL